ncbi:hypothetical protein [Rasiella sp. SM2506]|uniref:hypothetical protein n=1 Tax=Rasiella sp. SM2506 TaxID=3423914 RepID=UPI003D7BBBBD
MKFSTFRIASKLGLCMFVLSASCVYAQGSFQKKAEVASQENLKEQLKKQQDSADFLLFEGKYNEVITRSIENIALAEKIGDSGAAYYSRYMIAATHLYLEEYDATLRYIAPYKEYAEKNKDTLRMGRAYNLIGAVYVYKKEYAKSIPLFKESLVFFKALRDTLQITISYHNMTESYINEDDFENAQKYFDSTTVSLNSMKEFKGLTTEYNLLAGRLKMQNKEYADAVRNFETSIDYGESSGYIDSYVVEAYKRKSEALFALKKPTEAYNAFVSYDSINKVLFEKDKIKIIENATAKFDTEQYKAAATKADLENKLNEERLSNQQIIMWLLVLFGIVIVVLLFIAWRMKKQYQ